MDRQIDRPTDIHSYGNSFCSTSLKNARRTDAHTMAIAEVTGVKDPPVVGGWSQVGWSQVVSHRWSVTGGQQ